MVKIRRNRPKLKAPSQEERLALWERHFQDLLSKPSQISEEEIFPNFNGELMIKEGIFAIDELQKAVRIILNKKSLGVDIIPAEVKTVDEFNRPISNSVYN